MEGRKSWKSWSPASQSSCLANGTDSPRSLLGTYWKVPTGWECGASGQREGSETLWRSPWLCLRAPPRLPLLDALGAPVHACRPPPLIPEVGAHGDTPYLALAAGLAHLQQPEDRRAFQGPAISPGTTPGVSSVPGDPTRPDSRGKHHQGHVLREVLLLL